MPMLIYAATSLPSPMTTDSFEMYFVAAAKNGDHQAYSRGTGVAGIHNKSFKRFYELPTTFQMLKTHYRKRC
jgi:hypothetical protein